MVRTPCCEKMGLKKGPWTPEEDRILISYIHKHGHANWRALPKEAGLLRCGKSCRLRWINYLRPDIKRGNFTYEEEETIIRLHETLGNRWSAIAAQLPGRTDNEIKNVWHTHLKKRLNEQNQAIQHKRQKKSACSSKNQSNLDARQSSSSTLVQTEAGNNGQTEDFNNPGNGDSDSKSVHGPSSPQRSCSDVSSITEAAATASTDELKMDSTECFPEFDESFWSDALSSDDNSVSLPSSFEYGWEVGSGSVGFGYVENVKDEMDFWYDLFVGTGGKDLDLGEF